MNSEKNLKSAHRAATRDDQLRNSHKDALQENCAAQKSQKSEILAKLDLEIKSQKDIQQNLARLKKQQKNLDGEIPELTKKILAESKSLLASYEDLTNLKLEVTQEAQLVATKDNKKKIIDPAQPFLTQIMSF